MNARHSAVMAAGIALLAGDALAVAASPETSPKPHEKAADAKVTISVSEPRIGHFVSALSSEVANTAFVGINVEEARWLPWDGDSEETAARLAERRRRGIAITLLDATLDEVLDRLMKVDDRYEYSRDNETGMVNIYPKENAPMGWTTDRLSIRNKTVWEILVTEDLLGLRHRNIIVQVRGNLSWMDTRITLETEPITARQALNALCAQLDFDARWDTYEGFPPQGEMKHGLRIHGVSPSKPHSRPTH